MAAVRPIRPQSYEQIYSLLKTAILEKRCLSARYRGHERLLCPYVLGRSCDDNPRLLAYQYGGKSASGLGPKGSPDNWRCISLDKLTDVCLIDGDWIEPPNRRNPQACIAAVEFDANAADSLSQSSSA